MSELPPMEPHRIIRCHAPSMGPGAKRLHMLRTWLEVCYTDRKYDDQVYPTECRLREQAAALIGFLA